MPSRNQKTQNDCIHEAVMNRLHDDHIAIQPRVYHVIGSLLVGVGIASTILVSVFFTHVLVYRLKAEQIWGLAGFGMHGLWAFVVYFPWLALFLAFVGLAGGTHLLKQYDFGCKHRLSRVMIAGGAVIVSFGLLLEYIDFGARVRTYSLVETVYRETLPLGVVEGRVVRTTSREVLVHTKEGNEVKLAFKNAIVKPKTGSYIRVIGRVEGSVLHVQQLYFIK